VRTMPIDGLIARTTALALDIWIVLRCAVTRKRKRTVKYMYVLVGPGKQPGPTNTGTAPCSPAPQSASIRAI
jgi:hypothetical protein